MKRYVTEYVELGDRTLANVKLFGGSKNAARVARREKAPKQKKEKVKRPLRTVAILLFLLLVLEGCYFFCCYTTNSFVTYWRTAYINTALSTMRHRWLATALLPKDVVQAVIDHNTAVAAQAANKHSSWEKDESNVKELETEITEITPESKEEIAREEFYELFWEIDEATMEAYIAEHPEVLENGWANIDINEAGLDDEGTSIYSTFGEQVLAIDAKNKILLLRVADSGYRGVLAVAKDPSLLSMEWSAGIGSYGQYVGTIAERVDGVLAMTASGFIDEDAQGNEGAGNGGILSGYAMCNGVGAQGRQSKNTDWHQFVRMEMHENDLMYIRSINDPVSEECTDALEFEPAMIVDGEVLVSNWWVELNPRTAIGQSDKYEYLLLAIEGRNPAAGILGTDVNVCAQILKRHNCMQAINLDGGTSTIMWYDGEYVIRCSNVNLPKGRPLPNAFVYHQAK